VWLFGRKVQSPVYAGPSLYGLCYTPPLSVTYSGCSRSMCQVALYAMSLSFYLIYYNRSFDWIYRDNNIEVSFKVLFKKNSGRQFASPFLTYYSIGQCAFCADQLRRHTFQRSWTSSLELPDNGPQMAGLVIQPLFQRDAKNTFLFGNVYHTKCWRNFPQQAFDLRNQPLGICECRTSVVFVMFSCG